MSSQARLPSATRLARPAGWRARVTTSAARTAALGILACSALGLASPAWAVDVRAPTSVRWQLSVLRDGVEIDRFGATTAVGQAETVRRCKSAGRLSDCAQGDDRGLERLVTVSPVSESEDGSVDFQISTEEQLPSDSQVVRSHSVNARHDGLRVPNGGDAQWTLVKKTPTLVYRVQAQRAAGRN
ncbi:hypothetical protein [Chitinasiproducens palmae]|uniref:Uncharacterized protein n=1 Tax=Chitinasiproducens palmae TaxID=1770053 RepID=A0A1H2PP98_9BURK|nr:hypothetical protein [Chitinasiproducens palmae]SDV48575.1 hypothetical protein SAMN05216551_105202 [Chitinasiproducens palmae]